MAFLIFLRLKKIILNGRLWNFMFGIVTTNFSNFPNLAIQLLNLWKID